MLAAAVVFLVAQSTFGALPEYEIIDLGTLGGSSSYPLDINDDGQVVGNSQPSRKGMGHSFLWDEVNGMVNLTDLLGETPEWDDIKIAIAINNNGQIVGRLPYEMTNPREIIRRFFLWDSESGFVELTAFANAPLLINGDSIRAINDNMQIVGTILTPSLSNANNFTRSCHALLWDSVNGAIDLGTLGGNHSFANNINESGIVVGASETGNLNETHAFVWDSDNGMINLGTLNGNKSSAWAINNLDKVVGASVLNERDENNREINHAFIWTQTDGMVDIHDSNYLSSIALGANDADQVVGVISNNISIDHLHGSFGFPESFLLPPLRGVPRMRRILPLISAPATDCDPFLWDKRYGMVNLNNLLDEDSGWDHLKSAKDINYKGQIIGIGYINGEQHAFLMNPVLIIPAEVEIRPGTLNLSSRGKFNCNIKLPEDYDVAEINTDSILLADTIEPDQVRVDERNQVATAIFNREGLRDILSQAGEVELTVSGELTDGTRFEGTAAIKVIDRATRAKQAATIGPKRHRRGRK